MFGHSKFWEAATWRRDDILVDFFIFNLFVSWAKLTDLRLFCTPVITTVNLRVWILGLQRLIWGASLYSGSYIWLFMLFWGEPLSSTSQLTLPVSVHLPSKGDMVYQRLCSEGFAWLGSGSGWKYVWESVSLKKGSSEKLMPQRPGHLPEDRADTACQSGGMLGDCDEGFIWNLDCCIVIHWSGSFHILELCHQLFFLLSATCFLNINSIRQPASETKGTLHHGRIFHLSRMTFTAFQKKTISVNSWIIINHYFGKSQIGDLSPSLLLSAVQDFLGL